MTLYIPSKAHLVWRTFSAIAELLLNFNNKVTCIYWKLHQEALSKNSHIIFILWADKPE